MISKETLHSIVELLIPEMENNRDTFVQSALYGCPVLKKIAWGGGADAFTSHLVLKLLDFGECSEGQLAIVILLEYLKPRTGVDKREQIDALIQACSKPNDAVSLPETQQLHSKSVRERYTDLPSDEDRARFRALGVLGDLPFDDLILMGLWGISFSDVEIYVFDLKHAGLLESLDGGLYKQSAESRIEAKKRLKAGKASEKLNHVESYANAMNGLEWTPEEIGSGYLGKYDLYFSHLEYVIGLVVEERPHLPQHVGYKTLKKFSRTLYNLGLQWTDLESHQNAIDAFKLYEYVTHDLDTGSLHDYCIAFYKVSYCCEELSFFKDAAQYLKKYINLVHVEIEEDESYANLLKRGYPSKDEAVKHLLELRERAKEE